MTTQIAFLSQINNFFHKNIYIKVVLFKISQKYSKTTRRNILCKRKFSPLFDKTSSCFIQTFYVTYRPLNLLICPFFLLILFFSKKKHNWFLWQNRFINAGGKFLISKKSMRFKNRIQTFQLINKINFVF